MGSNIYVFNQDIPMGQLIIESDGSYKKAKIVVELTDEQSQHIKTIIKTKNKRSLCISIYRDGLIIDGVIYNICFSCGDIDIDGKVTSFDTSMQEYLRGLLPNGV